jgi:hypothetical protein
MINLVDQKYNLLTVVRFIGRDKKGVSIWECRCDCGKIKAAKSTPLKAGHVKSCGCLKGRNLKELKKHGEAARQTREYNSWCKMKQRCYNPNHKFYKDYGGRGVIVSPSWLISFENFITDMGRAPSSQHTLDRFPNKNGNYELGNCRWATKLEQGLNKRNNVLVCFEGESMPLSEYARRNKITHSKATHLFKTGKLSTTN